ncbi:hypothetical protein AB6A40_000849 [Gnathostoma spinigerum]|uniref:Uncharacterized protein n=1 Tax=Gnathostoma spinigerum TaxID=75299 RepID=A0ABD6E3W3_9BILA
MSDLVSYLPLLLIMALFFVCYYKHIAQQAKASLLPTNTSFQRFSAEVGNQPGNDSDLPHCRRYFPHFALMSPLRLQSSHRENPNRTAVVERNQTLDATLPEYNEAIKLPDISPPPPLYCLMDSVPDTMLPSYDSAINLTNTRGTSSRQTVDEQHRTLNEMTFSGAQPTTRTGRTHAPTVIDIDALNTSCL